MSVTIRPYRHGGWEADIRFRLPNGPTVSGAHESSQCIKVGRAALG
jgi:hypothetical protein